MVYHIIVGDKVCWGHHFQSTRPEPSVDVQRLEVIGLAALNLFVAQSTRGVDILKTNESYYSKMHDRPDVKHMVNLQQRLWLPSPVAATN
jgi:hypothetical protein